MKTEGLTASKQLLGKCSYKHLENIFRNPPLFIDCKQIATSRRHCCNTLSELTCLLAARGMSSLKTSSWLGECVVATVYCVVCVIEYGWYVGRGDCGVCGWKNRCRDGNLRTYCHVSPILFGWFFVEASPTCFCIFVKCFFCNLNCFRGFFGGSGLFWDYIPCQ